jgi:hypothetical protein
VHIIDTDRLATLATLEVHMIVVMRLGLTAPTCAKRVFSCTCIIQDLVDKAFIQKTGQGTVNRHSITLTAHLVFDFWLRQSDTAIHE